MRLSDIEDVEQGRKNAKSLKRQKLPTIVGNHYLNQEINNEAVYLMIKSSEEL
jgi:hypothetical protein